MIWFFNEEMFRSYETSDGSVRIQKDSEVRLKVLGPRVDATEILGFFAEACPVQIFVSNHLIPDDMVFQSGDVPSYETSDGSVRIQKASEVRLKVLGPRVDATEIFCIGTIKDDFLGLIGDPGGAT